MSNVLFECFILQGTELIMKGLSHEVLLFRIAPKTVFNPRMVQIASPFDLFFHVSNCVQPNVEGAPDYRHADNQ